MCLLEKIDETFLGEKSENQLKMGKLKKLKSSFLWKKTLELVSNLVMLYTR